MMTSLLQGDTGKPKIIGPLTLLGILVRGKIDRFSIDLLVKLLAMTGRHVEIKVKRPAA